MTPDRLGDLRARIEAGETVTQAEIRRLGLLQALDLARLGREFLIESIALHEAENGKIESLHGAG